MNTGRPFILLKSEYGMAEDLGNHGGRVGRANGVECALMFGVMLLSWCILGGIYSIGIKEEEGHKQWARVQREGDVRIETKNGDL